MPCEGQIETWLTAFQNQLKKFCQIFVSVYCYSCNCNADVCCHSLYNSVLLFTVTACITLCCCLLVQLVNSVLLVAVTTVPCEGQIERDLADGLPEPAEDVLLDCCCCLLLQPVNSMLLFAVTACMTLCCCLLLQPVTVMLQFTVTACKLYVAVCCHSL